jgi:hypothetical protein
MNDYHIPPERWLYLPNTLALEEVQTEPFVPIAHSISILNVKANPP